MPQSSLKAPPLPPPTGRIGVLASGGLDSTVLLNRLLTTSDAEIVAIHLPVRAYVSFPPSHYARDRAAFYRVTDWLLDRTRHFERAEFLETVTHDPDGRPYDRDEELPVREGFKTPTPTFPWRCWSAQRAMAANAFEVDRLYTALLFWDVGGDNTWDPVWEEYDKWTDIPLLMPFLRWDGAAGDWRGRSKLRNFLECPPDLYRLTSGCDHHGPSIACRCRGCVSRTFWHYIAEPNIDRLSEIEDRIEKRAGIGRYWREADPETHTLNMAYLAMRDFGYWHRAIRQAPPRDMEHEGG